MIFWRAHMWSLLQLSQINWFLSQGKWAKQPVIAWKLLTFNLWREDLFIYLPSLWNGREKSYIYPPQKTHLVHHSTWSIVILYETGHIFVSQVENQHTSSMRQFCASIDLSVVMIIHIYALPDLSRHTPAIHRICHTIYIICLLILWCSVVN